MQLRHIATNNLRIGSPTSRAPILSHQKLSTNPNYPSLTTRSTATLNRSNLRFISMPLQAVGAAQVLTQQEARDNAAEAYSSVFNRASDMFDFISEAAAHDARISFDDIEADLRTMHRDMVKLIRSVDLDPEELRRFGLRPNVQEWDEYIPNSSLEAVFEVLSVLDYLVTDLRVDFHATSQQNNPALSGNSQNRREQEERAEQYSAEFHMDVFDLASYDHYDLASYDHYEELAVYGHIVEEGLQEVLSYSFESHRQAVLDEMVGASEEQIDSLETTIATENDKGHSCCICMTDFEEGEELRELACFDRFHKDCIDAWLRRNANCPVDRSDAFPAS